MAGQCEVVFGLDTPADWGVRMIEIGAKFFYQDQKGNVTHDWFTNRNVNILTGGRESLFSNEPQSCVQQIFAAVKVQVPGEQPATFTGTDLGDAQHCKLKCQFIIAPKLMADGSFEEISLEDALNRKVLTLLSRSGLLRYVGEAEQPEFFAANQ